MEEQKKTHKALIKSIKRTSLVKTYSQQEVSRM